MLLPTATPIDDAQILSPPAPAVDSAVEVDPVLPSRRSWSGDVSMDAVLAEIARTAREVLSADYVALGVSDRDGGPEQFVHVGTDESMVARIGDLPTGRGIVGELNGRPGPLRGEQDPASQVKPPSV